MIKTGTVMNEENKQEKKWSTPKLFIGLAKIIINMSTVSWGIYTFFTQKIINRIFIATNGELIVYLTSPVMIILVSGWVLSTVIMGCNLQKAVSSMLENAKINAEFKAGFMKNIDLKGTADAAQIITALNKI
jgi:hypothetical protein